MKGVRDHSPSGLADEASLESHEGLMIHLEEHGICVLAVQSTPESEEDVYGTAATRARDVGKALADYHLATAIVRLSD